MSDNPWNKEKTRAARRAFLKTAGSGALAGMALAACGGGGGGGGQQTTPAGPNAVPLQPFAVPPLLDPAADPVTGVRTFNLNLQPGQVRFTNAGATNTWGVNGPYLGPTLRMSQGDKVALNVTNGIGRDTTMHWHGMHVPSDMDGGPHQLIAAGNTWQAAFTVSQRAAACWYHPHPHGNTAEQVYHGLAGMILVDDAESRALPLPLNYGVDDFPVVIQDRLMDANGVFSYLPLSRQERMRGKMGNTPLVNGVVNAVLDVPAGLIRFRLLNGSNARVYRVAFTGGAAMQLIAGDQSLLAAPAAVNEVTLSPGERAEVVVDFSALAGAQLTCVDNASGWTLFTVRVGAAGAAANLPAALSNTLNLPVATPGLPVRSFVLGMNRGVFTINGAAMNMTVINARIPANTLEIWDVQNGMNMPHNFHVHGTAFSVLDRNGGATPLMPHEKAWKDTVYLPPNERVRLLVKFASRTVANAPLMYHCHVLEHEDNGMMGQFEVI